MSSILQTTEGSNIFIVTGKSTDRNNISIFWQILTIFQRGGGFDRLGEGLTGGGDRVERRIFRTYPFAALREYFRGYFQDRRTVRRQKGPFVKAAFTAFRSGQVTDYGPLA
jgi:hypothetical protein